jgi:hypothetical protein
MSLLGIKTRENPFYAPYDDECWMRLALIMMSDYAESYSHLIPTTAMSQEEYLKLDAKSYAPARKSILRKVQTGPLGNVIGIKAIHDGFEKRRLAYKKSMRIPWADSENLQ